MKKSKEEMFSVKGTLDAGLTNVKDALNKGGFTNVRTDETLDQITGDYKRLTVWGKIILTLSSNTDTVNIHAKSITNADNIYALFNDPNRKILDLFKVNLKNINEINPDTPPLFGRQGQVDLSLFDEYYEKEFRKISESKETYKGKWNWAAFWLCGLWLLLKGLWKHAIILVVSTIVIRVLFGPIAQFLLGSVYFIFLGYRGTWLLYNVKIKKIQFPKSF
jgi:hypothetical protein